MWAAGASAATEAAMVNTHGQLARLVERARPPLYRLPWAPSTPVCTQRASQPTTQLAGACCRDVDEDEAMALRDDRVRAAGPCEPVLLRAPVEAASRSYRIQQMQQTAP